MIMAYCVKKRNGGRVAGFDEKEMLQSYSGNQSMADNITNDVQGVSGKGPCSRIRLKYQTLPLDVILTSTFTSHSNPNT